MSNRALVQMAAELVASHASTHELTKEELLSELQDVFKALTAMAAGEELLTSAQEATSEAPAAGDEAPVPLKPAVPLQAAFGTEQVFCMVCGQGMKTLRRHLSTAHGMSPREYRKTFGVPASTPLVAKAYSDSRKAMAKELNLADRLVKARQARVDKRAAAGTATPPAAPAAERKSKEPAAKRASAAPKFPKPGSPKKGKAKKS